LISVGDTVFYKRFVEKDVVPVTVVKVHKTDRVTVNDGSKNFALLSQMDKIGNIYYEKREVVDEIDYKELLKSNGVKATHLLSQEKAKQKCIDLSLL
jgi:hypothetical protein